jgi:hypothetical protein
MFGIGIRFSCRIPSDQMDTRPVQITLGDMADAGITRQRMRMTEVKTIDLIMGIGFKQLLKDMNSEQKN